MLNTSTSNDWDELRMRSAVRSRQRSVFGLPRVYACPGWTGSGVGRAVEVLTGCDGWEWGCGTGGIDTDRAWTAALSRDCGLGGARGADASQRLWHRERVRLAAGMSRGASAWMTPVELLRWPVSHCCVRRGITDTPQQVGPPSGYCGHESLLSRLTAVW